MSAIPTNFGQGGANLAPGGASGSPDLATALREGADDFETLRAQFNALLTKLDADAGVTDVNYSSTLAIASNTIKTKKA